MQYDDFTFPIVNFLFISINSPTSPAYGVYISQLVRYFRTCAQYSAIGNKQMFFAVDRLLL